MKKISFLLVLISTITLSSCKSNSNNVETTSRENEASSINISNESDIYDIKVPIEDDEFKINKSLKQSKEERIISENALKNFSCCKIDENILNKIDLKLTEKNRPLINRNFICKKSTIYTGLVKKLSPEKVDSFEKFSAYLFQDPIIYSYIITDNIVDYTLEISQQTYQYNSDGIYSRNNYDVRNITCYKEYFYNDISIIKQENFELLEKEVGEKIIDIIIFQLIEPRSDSISSSYSNSYALVKTNSKALIVLLDDDELYWRTTGELNNDKGIRLPSFMDVIKYDKNPNEWSKWYDTTYDTENDDFNGKKAEQYIKDKKYIYTIPEFIKHCKGYLYYDTIPENIQKAMDSYGIPKP